MKSLISRFCTPTNDNMFCVNLVKIVLRFTSLLCTLCRVFGLIIIGSKNNNIWDWYSAILQHCRWGCLSNVISILYAWWVPVSSWQRHQGCRIGFTAQITLSSYSLMGHANVSQYGAISPLPAVKRWSNSNSTKATVSNSALLLSDCVTWHGKPGFSFQTTLLTYLLTKWPCTLETLAQSVLNVCFPDIQLSGITSTVCWWPVLTPGWPSSVEDVVARGETTSSVSKARWYVVCWFISRVCEWVCVSGRAIMCPQRWTAPRPGKWAGFKTITDWTRNALSETLPVANTHVVGYRIHSHLINWTQPETDILLWFWRCRSTLTECVWFLRHFRFCLCDLMFNQSCHLFVY